MPTHDIVAESAINSNSLLNAQRRGWIGGVIRFTSAFATETDHESIMNI
jgi:hypothetical protein